jgi:uncharacterized OB-fold protein
MPAVTESDTVLRPELEYQQFLAQGLFRIQRSRSSGCFVFYPRIAEPLTGAQDLQWVEPSGLGTVYATTVMRQRAPADNYNVALIDLVEGVRMMARVEGLTPEAVTIGMAVKARVTHKDGVPMVVFYPINP